MFERGNVEIYVNGKRADSDALIGLSSSDYSPAVFESLKSYRGVIFRLEKHLNRLFESAKTVGLKLPKTRAQLIKELEICTARHRDQDLFLRLGVNERNSYVFVLKRE